MICQQDNIVSTFIILVTLLSLGFLTSAQSIKKEIHINHNVNTLQDKTLKVEKVSKKGNSFCIWTGLAIGRPRFQG